MKSVDYDQHQTQNAQSNSEQVLEPGDARVGWIGWISVRDSRAISAACDRWLAKRGVWTRSAWLENRIQFGKKK
jgi:hypothetical protein